MTTTATLKNDYKERIVPALMKEFNYTTVMQVPVLKKIVINQGLGQAVADKKIIETAISELTAITGQKAIATLSRKDISNFKLRKKMPIGVMVTLRRERMYEFLERLNRKQIRRKRKLYPRYSGTNHFPRNKYRYDYQTFGNEYYLCNLGTNR